MKQHDDIPDWAKIKAYREAYPAGKRTSDVGVLNCWCDLSLPLNALARRIARDDKPPVSQEVLIWREAWARDYDKNHPHIAKEYREGLRDRYVTKDLIIGEAIKLALEGFGKDGVTDNG